MLAAASADAPGNYAAVFNGPAFAAEKQPAAVREAYIEVQLQVLLALSAGQKCDMVRDQIDRLSLEDAGIPFTLYGFGQFTRAAHFQYYLGVAEERCGNAKEAEKYWSKVAKLKEAPGSPDFAYPALAASRLKLPNAQAAAAEALKALQGAGGDQDTRTLGQALLLRVQGQEAVALAGLGKAARDSTNVLVRYLAMVELARNSAK
jgi:hypothetical protein